jgi:hypothetical protein
METKKFILLDVCLSDYFRGHSNTVFCTSVNGETTFNELIEGLEADMINWDSDFFNGFTGNDLDYAFEKFKKDNENLINSSEAVFPDLDTPSYDEIEGHDIDCYAYFTVMDN